MPEEKTAKEKRYASDMEVVLAQNDAERTCGWDGIGTRDRRRSGLGEPPRAPPLRPGVRLRQVPAEQE